MTEVSAMSRWTDEEIRELVTLWPTNSASQIAKRLHRLRSAIRSKAERLRQEGLLPNNPPQHFDVNPPKRRPRAEIRHG
jgi:GcrA cell cycle regulator